MATSLPKPPKGHLNVLYFAGVTTFSMRDYESFPAPLPLGKLCELLERNYPGINEGILSSCLVTVNMDYVDMSTTGEGPNLILEEGDEVAFIPPVSSG